MVWQRRPILYNILFTAEPADYEPASEGSKHLHQAGRGREEAGGGQLGEGGGKVGRSGLGGGKVKCGGARSGTLGISHGG